MSAVGNPEPDGRQDPQLGGQRSVGARRETRLGLQQGVDLFDELREDVEKRGVERLVEFRILAADGLRGIQPAHQFVDALVTGNAADLAAESIDLLDVVDGKVDIVANVTVFDPVGVDQRTVDLADMVVLGLHLVVLRL